MQSFEFSNLESICIFWRGSKFIDSMMGVFHIRFACHFWSMRCFLRCQPCYQIKAKCRIIPIMTATPKPQKVCVPLVGTSQLHKWIWMLDHKAKGPILLLNDGECINVEFANGICVLQESLVKVQNLWFVKWLRERERERGTHTHFEVCMCLEWHFRVPIWVTYEVWNNTLLHSNKHVSC